MTIGQRISELRRSFGYSQEYLAEKLNVSRQAVSKWEQDLSAPDTYNLIALAELLGVTVEYLAVGKKQEVPPAATSTAEGSIPDAERCTGVKAAGATTQSPPAPPARKEGGTQRTVGYIFLAIGLFGLVVGVPMSWVLSKIMGIAFLRTLFLIPTAITIIGILCLVCKKHLGLVLLWLFTIAMFFVAFMLMPVELVPIADGTGGTIIRKPAPTMIPFSLLLIFTVCYTVATIVRAVRRK